MAGIRLCIFFESPLIKGIEGDFNVLHNKILPHPPLEKEGIKSAAAGSIVIWMTL
jgi:hypothetical protein